MVEKLRNPFIPRLFIALVVILSGLAMVPYVDLSSEALGWQNFIGVYECTEDCLRSASLQTGYREEPVGYTLGARATIVDENGDPIQARVTISVRLPNGNTITAQKITDENGIALFTGQGGPGTYVVTITNLERPGYTFDPDNSDLTDTLVVP